MKIKLLLLIFFFFFTNINAQIGFVEHVIPTNNIGNRDLILTSILGDIDNDGDLDIIFATNDKIAWHENTSQLSKFSDQKIITENQIANPQEIFIADLDGDGDLDVLSSSFNLHKIAWYENLDGKGNFGAEQIISSYMRSVKTVHAADIDGDGDIDVISGSWSNGNIYWFENLDGKGDFNNGILVPLNAGIASVYATDIDGDGDNDILSASSSLNDVGWHENLDGKGDFSEHKAISSDIDNVFKVMAADFDNDGDMDILSSNNSLYGTDKIFWYENINGLGDFGVQQVISDVVEDPTFINTGDVDNDGFIDILYTSALISRIDNTSTNDKIIWHQNLDGSGNFGVPQTITTNVEKPSTINIIDLDNDGDNDLVSTSSKNNIAWYENLDSKGGFGIQQMIAGNTDASWEAFPYDLDGDGDLDLLYAAKHYNTVAWQENLGGHWDYSFQKTITSKAMNVQSVFAADLDGDGDLDALSASRDDFTLAWYENLDGKGNFGAKIKISESAFVSLVRAADFDNDGDIDVVAASEDLGDIYWFENLDGKGDFSYKNIIRRDHNKIKSLSLGDIDEDGDLDLLYTHDSGSGNFGSINWVENNNGLQHRGSITNTNSSSLDGVNSASIADFDNDGKKDVVATTNPYSGNSKIMWYKGIDGLGDFSGNFITINSNSRLVQSTYPADVDNDGDMDIVAASAEDKVAWYENLDGTGNFSTVKNIPTSISSWVPGRIYTADLNNDGNLDIVSAQTSQSIVIYENLGHLGNTISGTIQLDKNNDGCDINDFVVSNVMVVSNNGTNSFSTFTQNDGSYNVYTNAGNFTTSISSVLPNYYNINPISFISNFPALGNSNMVDFCLETNQTVNDVNISILPITQARPGFDTTYQLVFHNVGTTQLSGAIVLEFDNSKLSFLTASETISSQTTNSFTFNYSGLNPFETRTINLDFNVLVPPTTNIGDILSFTATINPISGDNTENDNVFTLNQTVIGSYDPNDIQVLEGDQILIDDADEYLHYIIRFQNTGTASAINVKVNNILDANLDWTTMQLESSSHTNRVEIKDGNQVSFIFNGIYLPDSTTDEPNSHGFIAYKIKPKSDVIVGDIMPNQADIFFDFNPAIVTNMVTTEITSSLSAEDNLISKFYVYPNPTTGVLNINSITQISKLEVHNNIGQVVLSEVNKTSIDVSSLNTGLYFIKIEDVNGTIETKKVVKK
ncbi:T9SS type A sorting domain-containing protein [uncultured Wocania sp.]|uniref:T9SS type A sorting domain-containing protein n=1 Tax=uncultured Wocania sp. TaxID=2834404 RepID=UPI0030F959D7